ncbi:hypothetical protein CRG98_037053 [Punica granatum]|uniref:Uncharacterized protein n=1 Tax=Punica granatum TaxID=22663 RepID=A0A2I0IEU5_PUNGR|nr:hypothetical protein CRG98_037053 [Punica granatum]
MPLCFQLVMPPVGAAAQMEQRREFRPQQRLLKGYSSSSQWSSSSVKQQQQPVVLKQGSRSRGAAGARAEQLRSQASRLPTRVEELVLRGDEFMELRSGGHEQRRRPRACLVQRRAEEGRRGT